jgi:hypothetical protein
VARPVRDSDERRKVRSAREILEEHGLALAFLAAVAAGIFMCIQVLRVALSESATVNLEAVRAERCYEAQRASLGAWAGVPAEELLEWHGAEEAALTRAMAARLGRRYPARAQLFCPAQGPRVQDTSFHYRISRGAGAGVARLGTVHGAAPAPAAPAGPPPP